VLSDSGMVDILGFGKFVNGFFQYLSILNGFIEAFFIKNHIQTGWRQV